MLAALSVQTTEDADRRRELDRLLLRTGDGDREAFAQLYARTREAVYALALSVLRDACEARNLALTRLRGRERQVNLGEEEWNAIPAQAPGVDPEDRQLLQEGLSRLGAEERQIILLHAVTGLKHREIAALLEQPLSTVLSKYHRGLKKLKSLMKGECVQ